MSMWFFHWYTDVLSDRNIAQMLPTCTVMGYLIVTPINNKITGIDILLQHTAMINEYLDSVTDSVTVIWLRKSQPMTRK